jgi:hypothetical protein
LRMPHPYLWCSSNPWTSPYDPELPSRCGRISDGAV